MRNKKSLVTLGIIVLVLFLGVGYAVVSSVYLNIGGTANVANSELKVEITNVEAETNMTDKTLDFSNVLSNNNLTSNFTLKNMSLNELVTITYTVTNNEKDVDAIISAIDGVDLTNSNSNCFDVNYQITDNETDLENNDKTMEVVVTVELIKTPLNDDESTTNVGLTLAAIPKGVDPSTIKPPSGTSDVLDNVLPVEWNSLDVVDNTDIFIENGIPLVKISNLTPTLSDLQTFQFSLIDDGEKSTYYCVEGYEFNQFYLAVYYDELALFSFEKSGDYLIDGKTITVPSPGLYTFNFALSNLDFDFIIEQRNSTVLFGEKYYLTNMWNTDVKENGVWVIFNEDGTLVQEDGFTLPTTGWEYDLNNIYNPDMADGVVSSGGKYISIGLLSEGGLFFVIESEYNKIKSIPLKFGEKYYCTVDNVNGGNNLGEYVYGYPDGSGGIGRVNGRIDYMPVGGFNYTSTEINSDFLPSGTVMMISNDGTTLTQMKNGEVMYVYTYASVSGLPIEWYSLDVANNTSVNVSISYDLDIADATFYKVSENVPNFGFIRNTRIRINGSPRRNLDLELKSYVNEAMLVGKYSYGDETLLVIFVTSAGTHFGTEFTEPGIYVHDVTGYTQTSNQAIYLQLK